MPLLAPDTDTDMEEGQRARLPELEPAAPAPSALDTAAAAERSSNIVSTIYDRLNSPRPTTPAVPGFDPLASVPKGYEQYADKFLDANSPDEMEWTRQRIDQEMADKRTIQQAGGWGVAATLAAGATDPLTIASMAIPVAGETRLANMARLAAISAGTTAAQEGIQQALTFTRTPQESLLNVGASAVLGGLLGSIAPRVPREQMKAPGITDDLGPATGSMLDDRTPVPPLPEPIETAATAAERAQEVHQSISEELVQQRERLVQGSADFTRGNDIRAAERELATHESALGEAQKQLESVPEAAKAEELKPEVLARMEAEDKVSYGENWDNKQYTKLRERAATKEAAQAAEQSQQDFFKNKGDAQQLIDSAAERVERQRGEVDRLNQGQEALKQLKAHDEGVAKAGENPAELVKLIHDEATRTALTEAMAAPTKAAEMVSASPDVLDHADTGLPPAEGELRANPTEDQSFGAAGVTDTGMEGQSVARGAKLLVKYPGRVAPGGRLLMSASLKARQLLENLVNLGPVLKKNMQGVANAIPIERLLWRQEGVWQQAVDARQSLFKQYRERIAGDPNATEASMSRRDFMGEVTSAMRRGDEHMIPEVADAAKQTRKLVFDPLYERAKALGILPEDAKLYAESYVMRQYDMQAINANMKDWMETLTNHFVGQGVERAEAEDIAHKATMNIRGSERGTMDWNAFSDIVPKSGQTKERTLSVPDEILEPYLNSDIDHLTHSYIRSMAPEVEMTERFGSRDLKDQIAEIKDEYSTLIQRKLVEGDNEGAVKLQNKLDSDVQDISAIRDRLYGVYGQPKDSSSFFVRAGRLLRANNVLRLLGGATISHIPDIANVITRYGLPQTFAAMAKLASSGEAIKMSLAEGHRLGAAMDMAMNTISVLGDFGSHSQFAEQRVAGKLTRAFTIATGETPLVTAVQMLASTMGQHEILSTAERVAAGQAIDKNLGIRLAQAGLDEPMLQRVAAEAAQNGREINGLKFGSSDVWKDRQAAIAFETAILKDAHGMTLRPSVADTPLLMSSEIGKAVLQFKTFAFAAANTVVNPLIQGIARGDPRAAAGLTSLVGAGTMSYMIKQWMAGQPIEFDNPGRFALEVLDKSNLMSWTADAIFPALWQMGFKDLSRWSDRDPIETLLGPSVGTATSTLARQLPAKVTGNADKPFGRNDLHFLRRTFLPGQNLWYFRRAVNATEDTIGDTFDLPGKSNADRAAETQAQ